MKVLPQVQGPGARQAQHLFFDTQAMLIFGMTRASLCGLALLAGATTADAFSASPPSIIAQGRVISGKPLITSDRLSSSSPASWAIAGPSMAAEGWQKAAQKAAVSCAIAVSLATGIPMEARSELTPENKVVAEAWTIVDATYVDRTFNNQDWFKIRQDLVKRK